MARVEDSPTQKTSESLSLLEGRHDEMEITAVPTGLVLNVGPFTLGKIRELAQIPETKRRYKGEFLCVLAMSLEPPYVIDPGPYADLEVGVMPDLDKILTWDLFSIAVQNRGLASPILRLYPNCAHCNKMPPDDDPVVLDVREINHFAGTEEGLEAIRKGGKGGSCGPIEVGEGVKLWLRPPIDVDLTGDMANAGWLAGVNLIYRDNITRAEVNGKEIPPGQFWDSTSDYEMVERIKEAFDDLWGGVDMFFTWECPHCSKEQQQIIPFALLFLPQGDLFQGSTLPRRKKGIKPLRGGKR